MMGVTSMTITSLASSLLVFCGVTCALDPITPQIDTRFSEQSITIFASHYGRFAHGFSWELTVTASANAQLTILKATDDLKKSFTVPRERYNKLRQLVG